jgi:propionyl-CoA synthetase
MTGEYGTAYRHSLDSPDAFWAEAAEAIEWDRKWDKVLDGSNAPFYH